MKVLSKSFDSALAAVEVIFHYFLGDILLYFVPLEEYRTEYKFAILYAYVGDGNHTCTYDVW